MSLREAQKRMTRELLLKEGLGQFETKGYAATTVDDIAAAAGTTRQTFYLHFSSKAQLMHSLIATVQEMRAATEDSPLTSVVESGDHGRIEKWLGLRVDRWPEIRPYLVAAHEAAVIEPDIHAAVDRWFESAIDDIEEGLNRADRFGPATRRARGALAFGQLEFASRRFFQHGWDVGRDELLALLTDSWCFLLTE